MALKKMKINRVPPQKHGKYLLSISQTHREKTASGLYIETKFEPNQHVEVQGIIEAVPATGQIPGLRVGDEVGFSYQVVGSRTEQTSPEAVFHEDAQTNPFLTTWSNGRGEKVSRVYQPGGKYHGQHTATLPGGHVEVVSRTEGTQKEWEAWFSQFLLHDNTYVETPDNMITIDDRQLWIADAEQIHVVRRAGTTPAELHNLMPLGDLVLCAPPPPGSIFERNTGPRPRWCKITSGNPELPEMPAEGYLLADLAGCVRYTWWGVDCLLVHDYQALAYSPTDPDRTTRNRGPRVAQGGRIIRL